MKTVFCFLFTALLCFTLCCAKPKPADSVKSEKTFSEEKSIKDDKSLKAGENISEDNTPPFTGKNYNGNVPHSAQQKAASEVIQRLLGKDAAQQFVVEIIEPSKKTDSAEKSNSANNPDSAAQPDSKAENDYFEVEVKNDKIILRGSNGVSACRALKWYLNEKCNCSVSWNGDNLNLPNPLPKNFAKYKEATPFKYRYIFNNCVYGYSMPWWKWNEWERMLDILAFNGINMPAMLLGQEKVWQETYKEIGCHERDLDNFFAGPAWYPWQWMGNLDGWGGPLPQSVIDSQCELQKKIVSRARQLGMKVVLPGFSGHIPKILTQIHPGLKYHTLLWWGFGPNYLLDWQDPMFKDISATFMENQRRLYGTDHYYNIDPFNEMTPPSSKKDYLTNMAKTIFSSIDESDPEGIWVLMTWFAKTPNPGEFWSAERTKDFFDAVPDNRLLAIELWGDNWNGTGWHKQNGWYNKPWIWSVLQNFGNRVDIYGGLNQIVTNYNKMQASPDKGNIQGIGIMTEGLDYNPIVYELVLDMMWGNGIQDIEAWKKNYLLKRYGSVPEPVSKAWDILYKTRYTQSNLVTISPLCKPPALVDVFEFDIEMIKAWELMIRASDVLPDLKNNPAYQFDLIMIGREAMGDFAQYYTIAINNALKEKNLENLKTANAKMLQYIKDFDRLIGTNEELLLGTWLEGARSWGADEKEKALLEWGAKRQITDWGGKIGSYAIKEWSGYFSDCMLPAWELYLSTIEESLRAGKEFDKKAANAGCAEILKKWPDKHSSLPAKPAENSITVSKEMWEKYGKDMMDYYNSPVFKDVKISNEVPGMAALKKVTATAQESAWNAEFAVDGKINGQFWSAPAPASLTVDLGEAKEAAAFQVFTYFKDDRYYQYTIEISVDGANWMQVVDMSENTKKSTIAGNLHKHNAGYAFRYARLNMLKNSANKSVHVIEFKILSKEDLTAIAKQ